MIHLALDGSFRQNLGGFLERRGRQERIRSQRSLGNTHQQLGIGRRLQLFAVLALLAGGVTLTCAIAMQITRKKRSNRS